MFRVLLIILLLLPFQFVSAIMRPSGWLHKKTPTHFMDSPPEWCEVGFGPPVYRHTLATHGNSEWTVFMSLTRMGP